MIHRNLWLAVVLVMAFSLMAGCEGKGGAPEPGQKLEGNAAPQYERILDPEYWTMGFKPEEMADNPEDKAIFDSVDGAIGITSWKKKSIEATEKDEKINIRSVVEFTGAADSLSAALMKVAPVDSNLAKNFNREDILVMIAAGNLSGGVNTIFDWTTEGEKILDILKASGGDAEQIAMSWGMMKQMVKGIGITIKEKMFSYIGQEMVLAFYTNPAFIGFERIMDAHEPAQTVPFRWILASSLEQPGFAEKAPDILKEFIMASGVGMMMGMTADDIDFSSSIQTKDVDGLTIYYVESAETAIAWAEFKDAIFMGDLETISNIPFYYIPDRPAKDAPAKYNCYSMADLDALKGQFYLPNKDEITAQLDAEFAGDEESVELYGKIKELMEMVDAEPRLGRISAYSYYEGGEVVTTMDMISGVGPIMLKGIDLWEMMSKKFKKEMMSEMENASGGGMM